MRDDQRLVTRAPQRGVELLNRSYLHDLSPAERARLDQVLAAKRELKRVGRNMYEQMMKEVNDGRRSVQA